MKSRRGGEKLKRRIGSPREVWHPEKVVTTGVIVLFFLTLTSCVWVGFHSEQGCWTCVRHSKPKASNLVWEEKRAAEQGSVGVAVLPTVVCVLSACSRLFCFVWFASQPGASLLACYGGVLISAPLSSWGVHATGRPGEQPRQALNLPRHSAGNQLVLFLPRATCLGHTEDDGDHGHDKQDKELSRSNYVKKYKQYHKAC